MQVKELEEGMGEVHERFEEALGHLEHEMRGKEDEIERVNEEVSGFFFFCFISLLTHCWLFFQVDRLQESVTQLEDELERVKEDWEGERNAVDQDRDEERRQWDDERGRWEEERERLEEVAGVMREVGIIRIHIHIHIHFLSLSFLQRPLTIVSSYM
jgi:predicted  nucleic acid-binding Zn-ribbon protein